MKKLFAVPTFLAASLFVAACAPVAPAAPAAPAAEATAAPAAEATVEATAEATATEAAAEEAENLANEAVTLLAGTGSRNENAPPFSAELLSLSPWLLSLLRPGAVVRSATSGGLAGRIGLLAARVPEGVLRQRLVALRIAMDRIASLEAERT